ncbi:hypothetical protein [Massilia horti]|uniref:HEPN domain-containing protein n=1 Tax=Massilia horti TaxID=2562153 RepID=A0A4Y9T7X5_9BURK|nr:hypothetical protein [Massilia horti]TFW33599.1 hypothetical protein E4O92_06290 [Massilia horti]
MSKKQTYEVVQTTPLAVPHSSLQIVADHLRSEAASRFRTPDGDYFGRSAFNRYYYATFLEIKVVLGRLRKEWDGNVAHADIPTLLRVRIVDDLKKGKSKAAKASDGHAISLCSQGIAAARHLAEMMETCRAIRVVADYNPEIPVKFTQADNFTLSSTPVNEAGRWPNRARACLSSIEDAWRQVNE